jgi:ferredoxin-type protein NapH
VPFGALAVLIVVGATVGTMACGWACPFGWLQDLASKVPTPRFSLPRWTGNMRYVVLAVTVLAVPVIFGDHPLFVCRLCPAAGVEVSIPRLVGRVISGQPAIWPDAPKFVILVVFLVAIFFIHRPFCRVLCPLGAINSLFNRFSLVSLRLNRELCSDCGRCHTLCSAGLEPEKKPNDRNCGRCFECTACSRKALEVGTVFDRPAARLPRP